jgi:hypothetical protein
VLQRPRYLVRNRSGASPHLDDLNFVDLDLGRR